MNRHFLGAILMSVCWFSAARAEEPLVTDAPTPNAFPLVDAGVAAEIAYDAADATVVHISASLFAEDIERVTGVKPALRPSDANPRDPAKAIVYAGTLGQSPQLDAIVKTKNVDTSGIQGKWESYVVVAVDTPQPGVDRGLLVIGSDRRGTAYGLFALSEAAGVSPWTWWADVPTVRHDNLYVSAGVHTQGPPSVKYRGIFLNDEDWGLQPWAAQTFEPKSEGGVGDVGPKTYAKIFELLLRLKANYCWPAMHDVTQAFNIYPENRKVADDYAIVMGSAHCEQMLRNNVTEWTDSQGRVGEAAAASYNWVTNQQGILDYWAKRLEENGQYENTYTLGLRGIHDSDMAGGGTVQQKAQRLLEIYAAQRGLLRKYVNPDVTQVTQIVCPYKEVLIYYQNGAVPPDDATLVWADDNHGYIRQLSTPAEQKRSGGSGVYYHVSYWGSPQDYLWLCTTPPALIWEEMSKAYDYGARTVWVVNVGDLKPAEIATDFFLTLAYDHSRYTLENLGDYLRDFATRAFGAARADEIAAILDEYYHLNFQRKPEHVGLGTRGARIRSPQFTDQEIAERLAAFDSLVQRADAVGAKLPPEYSDAFFELVSYPVRCSALQNQKILNMEINRRAAGRGDVGQAQIAADGARAAHERIQAETAYYNDSLAGGKWKYMMSAAPRHATVFRPPTFSQVASTTTPATASPAPSNSGAALPPADPSRFVEKDGYLSIAAEHPTRTIVRDGAAWKTIPGLGRLGDSVAVFPTTTPSLGNVAALSTSAPALEYDFLTSSGNAAQVTIQAIPTHRINPERQLRYAVAVDDETPQLVDLETPEYSVTWSENVLRAAALGSTHHNVAPGRHTLHIYMVDPGVVIDHITIDLGGLPKSYLPPAETGGGP